MILRMTFYDGNLRTLKMLVLKKEQNKVSVDIILVVNLTTLIFKNCYEILLTNDTIINV